MRFQVQDLNLRGLTAKAGGLTAKAAGLTPKPGGCHIPRAVCRIKTARIGSIGNFVVHPLETAETSGNHEKRLINIAKKKEY
jgi:hypothetical protein